MRVLIVATKSPWPAVGGGNVTLHHLLDGLVDLGLEPRVVALGPVREATGAPRYPVDTVPATALPPWRVAHHALLPPPPSLARFRVAALRRALDDVLDRWSPQVVHLEQLHTAWLAGAVSGRAAVVLRQQNVESVLLERFARLHGGPLRWLLEREARRVRRAELQACRTVDGIAAISEADATVLAGWAGRAVVRVVPAVYPAAPAPGAALEGDPPLLCLGSFDWAPNRDGASWLVGEVWPSLARRLPAAVLHLAGPGSSRLAAPDDRRVRVHGTVPDAAALYDPRAVALVPVRAGSGVRLRILEAWSCGVPVVTTTIGAEGLGHGPGDGMLIADAAADFAAAAARVAADRELRVRLVAAGQDRLAGHQPEVAARAAAELYQEVASAAVC